MTRANDTVSTGTPEGPILIRHTDDGRRVEVIGRFVCMDGRREADALVEAPSREASPCTASSNLSPSKCR